MSQIRRNSHLHSQGCSIIASKAVGAVGKSAQKNYTRPIPRKYSRIWFEFENQKYVTLKSTLKLKYGVANSVRILISIVNCDSWPMDSY